MQFSKMQNEIYRSLVMSQCHTKCTSPSTQSSQAIDLALVIYAAAAYHRQVSTPIYQSFAPYNKTTSSTKMHRYGMTTHRQ